MSFKTLLSIKKLSIAYINKIVVDELSLSVGAGEIVALVGANGCGKTTLLDTIFRRHSRRVDPVERDDLQISGDIRLASDLEVAYLPQRLASDAGRISRDLLAISESEIRKLCSAFGVDPDEEIERDWSPGSRRSDGETQKRAIIKVLLSDADLLLLDEPTNYLDIVGLNALEEQLRNYGSRGKGILVVSHDRTLINNLADRTYFMSPNGTLQTEGGYSAAWSLASSAFDSRLKQAKDIRKKIERLEQETRTRMGWSAQKEKSKRGAGSEKPTIAKQAKKMAARAKAARRKAEKEIERLKETKPFVPKPLNLHKPDYTVCHRDVFALNDVSFSYGRDEDARGRALLQQVNLWASTASRICIMGANGAGKSTLIKLCLGRLAPSAGEQSRNQNVNCCYVSQGLNKYFTREKLLDNFLDSGADETTIRYHLGGALICDDKVHQPLGGFSQGELMRAALVKCILRRAEFLFLDEPTSHLDIESIEVLEQLLDHFPGGYVIISHDRSFVEHVAETLYVLEDGSLKLV